jgi:hypothetical protein
MVPFVEWLCNGFPCFKPWKVWQQLMKTRDVSGFTLSSSASFCILESNSEAKNSWHWKNRRHLSENRAPEDNCTIFSSFFHHPDSIHHVFSPMATYRAATMPSFWAWPQAAAPDLPEPRPEPAAKKGPKGGPKGGPPPKGKGKGGLDWPCVVRIVEKLSHCS